MRRMRFCEKWMSWMETCVFSGRVSVLVNVSPTKEVVMQKGLRQGSACSFSFSYCSRGPW